MAKSKNDNNQKPQDSFEDDLDSMLNLDEMTEQEVGLIDDDDAIDRLLIGDAFESAEKEENEASETNDIDQLIDSEVVQDSKLTPEFDEFGDEDLDDLIADIQINPKQNKINEPEQLSATEDLIAENAEIPAMQAVEEIEKFAEDVSAMPELDAEQAVDEDVLEAMTEIDEFSGEAEPVTPDNADFLLADFDISVDDEFESEDDANSSAEILQSQQPEVNVTDELDAAPITEDISASEELLVEEVVDEVSELEAETPNIAEDETFEIVSEQQPEQINNQPEANYSVLIAGLTTQINDLVKQQAHVKNEVQLKSGKEELAAFADTVDSLKTEQKKAKRNIDALSNKKPITAYVANGIALVALIVGGSLGYQGYIAKSQVSQVIEYMGKMQAQINAAPTTADAAEKEMLRNQLDELARANSVTSEQIAELTKSLQGQNGTGKPTGDLGKQLSDLANQDMQMGSAIESLQSKIAALEKGKVATSTAKPTPKKPPVVQENWVVNLVAFKQDWYAKRKAEEFTGKGVPAKVSKAESKGETWYRLSVDGFKSQYEAAAYAARVKKTLNLDAVWVNKNKN